MNNTEFSANWHAALLRASRSDFCKTNGFFTLSWFLKNEENWRKCYDGNYDSNGHNGNGNGRNPAPVAEAIPEGCYTHPDDEFAMPTKGGA
jgi:hypothetical protein